ncbi:MAG: AAA family ATPase [Candidatus Sulfotelmatobacter sp.]
MLIVFSGLPGVGKTVIARELARQIGAVYVRVDSIEQALRDSGAVRQSLDDAGYRVGYAVAEDNLRLGRIVVADSVNPIALTRDAWAGVAKRAAASAIEIEVTCSDAEEHRRRVETRVSDLSGLRLPSWNEVVSREYQPWNREHIVVDTAGCSPELSVSSIREMLQKQP